MAVVAVKPQMLPEALPVHAPLAGGETLFLSVVAGVPHATYRDILGDDVPVVRTVPNTPASICRGITAMHGNEQVTETQMATGEALLSAVGKVVRLTREDQLRLVTAVAGCGPAYVFHLIEAMTEAVVGEGLPREIAAMLAVETVAGAGVLAAISDRSCAQLREDVTSPNGVTQAALKVLMDATRPGFRSSCGGPCRRRCAATTNWGRGSADPSWRRLRRDLAGLPLGAPLTGRRRSAVTADRTSRSFAYLVRSGPTTREQIQSTLASSSLVLTRAWPIVLSK